uniref:Uncharacterized protein n=1 Tax=Ascaris lumbricoides TaxID=6252 RepID=A0A0M3I4Q4_ASCLU
MPGVNTTAAEADRGAPMRENGSLYLIAERRRNDRSRCTDITKESADCDCVPRVGNVAANDLQILTG